MRDQLVKSGGFPPIRPNPKEDFVFRNGWYNLPKELSGKVASSPDELIELIKGKDCGHKETFITGFAAGNVMKRGINVSGYRPYFATLQSRGNPFKELKIGYGCEKCHKIITGIPEMEVSSGNTSITLICGNEGCNARLYESELNYLYYNRNPSDLDD